MTTVFDPGAAAARATDAILGDTLRGSARGIVVDSPPGRGSRRWWSGRPWSWPPPGIR